VKHLVFDVNIILTLWFGWKGCRTIEELVDEALNRSVTIWIPAASLPIIDYLARKTLKEKGLAQEQVNKTMERLMESLEKMASVCTNPGAIQFDAYSRSLDFEDAQTALAAYSIQGEKRLVTFDKTFDTLDLIETFDPAQALEWIRQESPDQPVSFIDLKAQQDTIRPQLEKNIHTVLKHGQYILGPEVKELEKRLCEYTGARHCVGVSSGTDALLMVLMAWGIGPGDAVFTTPFTFIATAEVIQLLGATPVFVDIDPKTFNIHPAMLELAIKAVIKQDPGLYPIPRPREGSLDLTPRAIVPVDLFGLPADYDPIMEIAQKYNLKVLSDSAQGFGSEYKGRKSGTLGHATATSFFPAKPLGCYGDGGAIFTDDDELAEILESIRVHGKGKDKYDNIRIGLNARLHTMQAAVLLAKLDIFPKELEAKQKVANQYTEQIRQQAPHLSTPYVPKGLKSAWAQYSVLAKSSEERDAIQASLKKAGIPSMVYYPKPLHMQPAFSRLGYEKDDFPLSVETSTRIFSLPMHGYLKDEQIASAADILKKTC